jgi:hypothetical protein
LKNPSKSGIVDTSALRRIAPRPNVSGDGNSPFTPNSGERCGAGGPPSCFGDSLRQSLVFLDKRLGATLTNLDFEGGPVMKREEWLAFAAACKLQSTQNFRQLTEFPSAYRTAAMSSTETAVILGRPDTTTEDAWAAAGVGIYSPLIGFVFQTQGLGFQIDADIRVSYSVSGENVLATAAADFGTRDGVQIMERRHQNTFRIQVPRSGTGISTQGRDYSAVGVLVDLNEANCPKPSAAALSRSGAPADFAALLADIRGSTSVYSVGGFSGLQNRDITVELVRGAIPEGTLINAYLIGPNDREYDRLVAEIAA